MYGPYMTIAEINAKYPNEWVYLAKPTKNRRNEMIGGHVVIHSADPAEYWRLFETLPEIPDVHYFASCYTGKEHKDYWEVGPPDAEPEPGAA